jgi:glyoxylase-like metal-dependent hydrolase (beta-lactamase superfamily II)
MKAWSIEGNTQRLDGGAMFGNVPRAMWERWLPPDADNRVPLSCRALLVELDDGRRVLFETGIGAFFDPKMRARFGVLEDRHVLLDSLAALGLTDADIDVVVLSHLHFDHAGGLLAAWQPDLPARMLFPKARFIIGRDHWERAQSPHPRDRASFIPELNALLRDSGRLELVDLGPANAIGNPGAVPAHCESLGADVGFYESHGHTPGLMLSEIGGDGGIVFCADLIPGKAWVHLPVTMGYDRYPELLIDEKRHFLADKLRRGVRLYFTHDPNIAHAAVQHDASGRYSTCDEQQTLIGAPLPQPAIA